MASYFYGDAFQQVIDENDYRNPEFVDTWEMRDEYLFDKAHTTFSELIKGDKPFFSLVFTSGYHDSFEFPDGKIKLFDRERQTRDNAAKYADYALGYFFSPAKNQSTGKNGFSDDCRSRLSYRRLHRLPKS